MKKEKKENMERGGEKKKKPVYRVSRGGAFRVKKTRDKLQTDDSITPYKDARVLLPTLLPRCFAYTSQREFLLFC